MSYVWQSKTWPHFKWENASLMDVLGKTRLAQGKLISRAEALGFDLSREARFEILSEETLKTAAIEGEKLDPLSVRSSVARHLGLPMAGFPAAERHVDGLVEVLLDATTNYARPLSLKRIKGWHAALFPTGYSGLHKITTGQWRKQAPMQVVSGPVGREKIHFEAPPSDCLEEEMMSFISWWNKSVGKVEGLLRAGIAHFYFVTIHPFEDGNGRLARALTEMALSQDEKIGTRFYSLSSQIMAERDAYYDVLEKTQKGLGDITPWLEWFICCTERAIGRSEKIIEKSYAKAAFWQRHAKTSLNDRQRKVINKLLDAGKGGFEGGLSTRKYVSLTKTSRATAYREITDLVAKKILLPQKAQGRSTHYELDWED